MLIYNKLFAILQLRNMRVKDLAMSIGASEATFAKLRKGQTVNTDVINRICKALDVQPFDIMEYIPDPTKE